MTGQVFGKLTAVRIASKIDRRTRWVCECECGRFSTVVRDNLVNGHTQSCGCQWRISRPPKVDLTGKKFGRLRVLSYEGRRPGSSGGDSLWKCRCICGNETVVKGYNLKKGNSRSCGCQIRIALLKVNTTHGRTGTPEYKVWVGMLTRCYNEKEKAYKFYGGRGIYVADCWRGENGFKNFFAAMGKRPSRRHQIERKDNDGPYGPDNCCWATRQEQSYNKRSTIKVLLDGVTVSLTEACRRKGLKYHIILPRVKAGMTFEQAATAPVRRSRGSGLRLVARKARGG